MKRSDISSVSIRLIILQRLAILPVIFFGLVQCSHNTKYSESVEQKINKVENNLGTWYRTQDNESWNLKERMKHYNIKGLSIAVVHDFKMEWVKGYGWADSSENRPVTDQTLFQAASISKSFNALGVLKLVQDKKIDLDRDINDYLETWKFPYDDKSNKKPITLTELLSHTAGLSIHGFPGYAFGDTIPTLSQVLDGKKPANTEAVRSLVEPGKQVIYSGGGVTISQMIVTDATHMPYEEYMQRNVLDPMGMKSSFFSQPPLKEKRDLLATGYYSDGKEVAGKYHIYPEKAAAGLWTNPADLCRYIIETQLSYNGKSSKVLTPEMTRLRLAPVLEDAALGVFVAKKGEYKYFTHNGGNEGFTCLYAGCLDNGEGVVIMTNSDNSAILDEVINSVATVYGWKGYYEPVIKNIVEVSESVLEKYTGNYNAGGNKIIITRKGNDLLLNAFGDQLWKLNFTSDSDFFLKQYKADYRFHTDSQGKVTGFIANGTLVRKVE
jgi:CubicO group peptidase (beta-lactamase class C family)